MPISLLTARIVSLFHGKYPSISPSRRSSPPPLENLEQAAFYARSLAYRLLVELAEFGAAPYRVEIEAEAADGEIRLRVWRSTDPFDETTLAERIRWQLRAWLDHARHRSGPGIRGGLVRLRIAPADISDHGRQLGLDEDARSAREARRSLTRAQSIVGPDGVLQAVPQGGRTPGQQAAWFRWGEDPGEPERDPRAPWPGRVPRAITRPGAPRTAADRD